MHSLLFLFFFSNDTAPTEIYTLSLHDALPIYLSRAEHAIPELFKDPLHERTNLAFILDDQNGLEDESEVRALVDRKSTRLNSSHVKISYAVFCLKKKK